LVLGCAVAEAMLAALVRAGVGAAREVPAGSNRTPRCRCCCRPLPLDFPVTVLHPSSPLSLRPLLLSIVRALSLDGCRAGDGTDAGMEGEAMDVLSGS